MTLIAVQLPDVAKENISIIKASNGGIMKINIQKQGIFLCPYSENDEEKLSKLSNGIYQIDLKDMDIRTLKQSASLHLWASQISKILNKNSLYMTGVFGNKIEWSGELVKTQIIKATIKKVFDIDSTTKLKRKEIDEMIDFVTIAFASKGVEIPMFPSRELWNENKKEK